MKTNVEQDNRVPGVLPPEGSATASKPPRSMLISCGLLLAVFAKPLLDLAVFALKSDVYSHILLMPAVVGYLLYTRHRSWPFNRRADLKFAVPWFVAGMLVAMGYILAETFGWRVGSEGRLAISTVAFVLFVYAIASAYLPSPALREAAFPLALLLFLAPFPTALLHAMERLLQNGSADAADVLFSVSGMPFVREATFFRLPGLSLEVAPECSGIRSTLALFITSLVGGYLLLRSPWRRAVLAGFVLPLALLRNGFRIFVIGQLCVQIGPEMIHSLIHKRGGPLFFILSLIPFMALLVWLRYGERRRAKTLPADNQGIDKDEKR